MVVLTRHTALGVASYLLALLQLSVAVAIAITVRQALWSYTGGWRWSPTWWGRTSAENVCLMSTTSANLCAFTYVVIAVSLAASVTLFVTQCFPRRAARCCAALELWLSALLAVVWAAAAAVATAYGVGADGASPPLPRHSARTAVWAMGWVEVALWTLSAALACVTRWDLRRRRRSSELELSMATPVGPSRYQRYNDTPFSDRTSKWHEVRDAYIARGAEAARHKLDP